MVIKVSETVICPDCWDVTQGDAATLDYHYSPEYADARLADIERADAAMPGLMARAAGEPLGPGESERDNEFSLARCGCCGDTSPGPRYGVDILAGC